MNGFTTIPRWTHNPVQGTGEFEVKVPDETAAALDRLANDEGVPFSSVLLTAHARVLRALSGESGVCTGYAAKAGPPLPLVLTPEGRSWRELLRETARAEADLPARRSPPIGGLNPNPDPAKPRFETVFEMSPGAAGPMPDEVVLRVCFADHDGWILTVRYRRDVLNRDGAARIAGYHLAALSSIASDPDAEHARQSLLSSDELRYQILDLAGPCRELPDCCAHEVFEERVREHPDAIAAEWGETRWTYSELNARANRVARALLARGLQAEGVVGVVTERNLDWMTAVLAVFKAGGAYLPVEPHFPAERIGRMLLRAGCRLVLTERGSTAMLERALGSLPGVETLFIDAAVNEGHSDGDPGVIVTPDRLAYIYFTSGSTGEPKGAMCEHAGMLNHLFAKIEDLDIGEGDVVAQTAPQCFDISMWQLVAPLLVGGRTLLVEQESVLDARRFIARIADGAVNVLQVVPSYLEVLLSCLEREPRALPDLRTVSATGEALKKELVERWFSVMPGVPLVNAYGLTETSDDTNHEFMENVPRRERVPIGKPVNNVRVYIVDEHLSPVPLGAPGEIVIAGICVGRGYINDPDRTRRAFLTDPYHPGQRLYRSGDFGRWLPEGTVEYLGRRDSQVKISGFRIEIGEIESSLLRLPGVGAAAVVVTDGADRSRHLVAFYSGERPPEAEVLRDQLGRTLPWYMVPAAFHRRETLPLTGNGKVDRKALTALAAEMEAARQDHEPPETPTERWLRAAWAEVLGIPAEQIGRRDHFFDIGGTSLSAVRLAIALDRRMSFKDLAAHPVLADQAALLDHKLEGGNRPDNVAVPAAGCAPAGVSAARREGPHA
jgi:amino acid adenylation domain-containing protein